MWETLWRFETANLVVTGAVAPEDSAPEDSFCEQDHIDAVHNGSLDWFCARVQVSTKAGTLLGDDYLGACAYENARDFFNEHIREAAYAREQRAKGYLCGSYFPDMIREAIKQARHFAGKEAHTLARLHA